MKSLFLINPRAGRGTALRVWRQIQARVARLPHCEAVVPARDTETRKVAAEAARAGVNRVVVIGGDGTLAAVAGELAGTDTALGVIPAGTGNDFCRNCGIPRGIQHALEIALGPQARRIDLGRSANGRYFLNAAGLGFDAEVAAISARYPTGLGGTLPYLLGALSTLAWFKPVPMEVTVDDTCYKGPAMLVAVANGRCYGGGMQIAPEASVTDGQLHVCVAAGLSRVELLSLLRLVYSGSHVMHPKVSTFRGRHVELKIDGVVRSHFDGEPQSGDIRRFEICPGALSVAAPTDPEWEGLGHSRLGTADSIVWSDD